MKVVIDSRRAYEDACREGAEPLLDRRFDIEHSLRVEIQRELFGKGHTTAENERFYRWVWSRKMHICENCIKRLSEYSATYVSHILARGAYPEMAHDPRNVNILCFDCHSQWENGNREAMRIYESNQITIAELKKEYSCI